MTEEAVTSKIMLLQATIFLREIRAGKPIFDEMWEEWLAGHHPVRLLECLPANEVFMHSLLSYLAFALQHRCCLYVRIHTRLIAFEWNAGQVVGWG